MFNDLREFIGKSEEVGEVKRVNGVDWKHEVGLITELNRSCMIFYE